MSALDDYADPKKHAITVEDRLDAGDDWQYTAVCACGWRGIPVPWHSMTDRACPVQEQLSERLERMRGHAGR